MEIYKELVGEIVPTYKPKTVNKIKIGCSKDAYDFALKFWGDDIEYRETVFIIPLNRANNTLGWIKISEGGTAGTVIDTKIIFQILLNCNASAFILCHNHPSGNKLPSEQDTTMTKKVHEGGKLLDINMLDHMVVTANEYFSYADEGILY